MNELEATRQGLATTPRIEVSAALQEKVLLGGDLSRLSAAERLSYYNAICHSLELNPLTRPFEYLNLSGKLVLYARKDCTEQLRDKKGVSITKLHREITEGIYVVTAEAIDRDCRTDISIGAVAIDKLQGDMRANAMMKAETKAKRRVTLSLCGLGMLDETEIETIPNAKIVEPRQEDGLEETVSRDTNNTPSQQVQDAPASNPQDYISKLKLSESVREASQVLNDVLSDEGLSEEDRKALQVLGKQRITDLSPPKRGQGARA